jgi:hypothetical protein
MRSIEIQKSLAKCNFKREFKKVHRGQVKIWMDSVISKENSKSRIGSVLLIFIEIDRWSPRRGFAPAPHPPPPRFTHILFK